MFPQQWRGLCFVLALSQVIYAHASDDWVFTEIDSALSGPFSRRNLDGSTFVKRQAGSKCGSTAGGASCGPGLCCSQDGVCGTGGAFCDAPACQIQYGPACDGNKAPTGQDTSQDPRPTLGSVPVGVVLTHCTVPGKVALTFDDGPYIYTSSLLDILSKAGVKATFFVVGINGGKGDISDPATGYPSVIQRMVKDGHQVGSHSWSHQDATTLNKTQRLSQIIRNEVALTKILGFFPAYYRPPYASTNADSLADLKALGYHVINYDLDTNDWRGDYTVSKNTFTSALASGTPKTSSFISLAHDIHQQTVTDLAPYMIANVRSAGYSFATVGECLGDPAANWYRDPVTGGGVKDTSGALAKAVDAGNGTSTNTTLPSATGAGSGAFGAQSSGHPNSTTGASNSSSSSSKSAGARGPVAASATVSLGVMGVVAALMSML